MVVVVVISQPIHGGRLYDNYGNDYEVYCERSQIYLIWQYPSHQTVSRITGAYRGKN